MFLVEIKPEVPIVEAPTPPKRKRSRLISVLLALLLLFGLFGVVAYWYGASDALVELTSQTGHVNTVAQPTDSLSEQTVSVLTTAPMLFGVQGKTAIAALLLFAAVVLVVVFFALLTKVKEEEEPVVVIHEKDSFQEQEANQVSVDTDHDGNNYGINIIIIIMATVCLMVVGAVIYRVTSRSQKPVILLTRKPEPMKIPRAQKPQVLSKPATTTSSQAGKPFATEHDQAEIQELFDRYNQIYDRIHAGVDPNQPMQVFPAYLDYQADNKWFQLNHAIELHDLHLKGIHVVMMAMNQLGRMSHQHFMIPAYMTHNDMKCGAGITPLGVVTLFDVLGDGFYVAETLLNDMEQAIGEANVATVADLARALENKP